MIPPSLPPRPSFEGLPPEAVAYITALETALQAVLSRLAVLEERLARNSSNSSQPPSADGPATPPRPAKQPTGKPIGGPKGHPGRFREALPPDQVTRVVEVPLPPACPECHHALPSQAEMVRLHQVLDLPPITAAVLEHHIAGGKCPHCGAFVDAAPSLSGPVSYGPGVTALVGVLSAEAQVTDRKIQSVVNQVCGLPLSLGTVARLRERAGEAVEEAVAELQQALETAPAVNMDETGLPFGNADGGNPTHRRGYLWGAGTPTFTVFHPALSRAAAEAVQLLPVTFAGALGTDRYAVYNQYTQAARQVCWAHIQRESEQVLARPGPSGAIGRGLRDVAREVFDLARQRREGTVTPAQVRVAGQPLRRRTKALLGAALALDPAAPFAEATASWGAGLLTKEPMLWAWLDHPEIEPHNNAAERAMRRAVTKRKVSGGVQSGKGAVTLANLLTVVETLRQQGRNLWNWLTEAMRAHAEDRASPSLLPVRVA